MADCTQACELISGIEAEYLFADRGYDTDEIIQTALASGMQPVIPPKKNRNTSAPMIPLSTKSVTWSKTHSFISSSGEALQRGMQKGLRHSLPLFRFGAWFCGSISRDDTL